MANRQTRRLDDTTTQNDDLCSRNTTLCPLSFQKLQYGTPLDDLAEDDMLAVKVGGSFESDEESRSVGVWPLVGHAEQAGARVRVLEVLICEV